MAGPGPENLSDLHNHTSYEAKHDSSKPRDDRTVGTPSSDLPPTRPSFQGSFASQETIRAQEHFRATPPINIPTPSEVVEEGSTEDAMIEHYMRTRQPSVSFNDEVKLDSGHRQGIDEPLERPPKEWLRGRSMMQALTEGGLKSVRSHSESEREHYDQLTGRHLPQFSSSPIREQAKIGEGRFPLLQSTVDAMARESRTDSPQMMSLTSDSTMSPVEEVRTPSNEQAIMSPPNAPSTSTGSAAFSYEERKPFRRSASQRWRDGEGRESGQDFFSRAGSLAKGRTYSSSRLTRQESNNASSFRSGRSAASSYLRAFSMSSSTSGDDGHNGPPAVDAEGQTIGEDYVLGKQIGWGGFSTIKEVTQIDATTHVHRKLAVKIVRKQIDGKSETENDQAQAEFDHEVELWRFLDHPNVLPLEAVYKTDEATFCFIPLAIGGTLFDLVRANRQGLPTSLARSYAHQLASALRYLHLDARVVHRDVKLENCLIDRNPNNPDGPGLVRLCDFGMSEWLSKDEGFGSSSLSPPSPDINDTDRPPQKHIGPADTSTSAFAGGSLEYAAPEILRKADSLSQSASLSGEERTMSAERSIVSSAVDMWAFGVCVYSIIVGSRPFQNSFQPRTVMAILAGDWDRERLAAKGGQDVCELVEGCLEMDEERRWDVQRVMGSKWMQGAEEEVTAGEGKDGVDGKGWKL